MRFQKTNTARRLLNKKVVATIIVLVAIGLALFFFFHHKNNPNLAVHHSGQNTVTGTTSKPAPHQVPSNSSSQSTNAGGIIDKSGQTSGTLPDSSLWASSQSGNITLQQPTANTTVKSGDYLSGTAKVSSVSFILVDNSVGQISQGTLPVVNGKFSGTLQFTPHSSSGRLEVYYPNPKTGAEEDIIEINVSFNL